MNASEVVRHYGLKKTHDETFRRSAMQIRSTVQSATLVMPGRAVRSTDDLQVDREARSRQAIQHAAIATDQRSARYRRSQSDVVGAAKNLSEWRKYLPDDCIKAMVAKGWHFTV
jgi:hypothetical protein